MGIDECRQGIPSHKGPARNVNMDMPPKCYDFHGHSLLNAMISMVVVFKCNDFHGHGLQRGFLFKKQTTFPAAVAVAGKFQLLT